MTDGIMYPFGKASLVLLTNAIQVDCLVENTKTIANLTISQASTLNLLIGSELRIGSQLILVVTAGAIGANLTLGDNVAAPVILAVLNKTKVMSFIYDGTRFLSTGTAVQID